MELRVLQYFLAVAREQNISAAAQSLHLTQPTLSRQLKELEEELGKQLMVRGNRKITLTEDGMLLRKRAEEILELVDRTEKEVMQSDEAVSGDIYIGTGETDGVRQMARSRQPGFRSTIRPSDFILSAATPWMCASAWTRGCWISAFCWGTLIKSSTTIWSCP